MRQGGYTEHPKIESTQDRAPTSRTPLIQPASAGDASAVPSWIVIARPQVQPPLPSHSPRQPPFPLLPFEFHHGSARAHHFCGAWFRLLAGAAVEGIGPPVLVVDSESSGPSYSACAPRRKSVAKSALREREPTTPRFCTPHPWFFIGWWPHGSRKRQDPFPLRIRICPFQWSVHCNHASYRT